MLYHYLQKILIFYFSMINKIELLILNKFYLNHKMQKDNLFLIKYNFENLINYLTGVIPELINFCFIHFGTVKLVKFSTIIAKNVEQFDFRNNKLNYLKYFFPIKFLIE
jgi:ABC-type antimicrobial peptide transport system permease subunit